MSQNLPKRSVEDFLFYVILTFSYLRERTIETSSFPNDSMQPLSIIIMIIIIIIVINYLYYAS